MNQATDKKMSKMPLLLIFFTVFIDLIGFGIIIPLLPTFAEKFGAGGLEVGLLLMSYSLMQFFFTPFWGRLSDKVGRRPILLSSLAASGIGYLIWGFAGTLPLLFLSRIVAGIGNANLAVAQAYIADVTTTENRAKGMGIVGAAFGLGFVLGPAIGGLCASHSYQMAGYVAAGFSFLDLILTFFCLPEPERRSQAGHERFRVEPNFYWNTLASAKLRVPLAIFFISTFAFAMMETTLVLLTEHQFNFDARSNGYLFAFIGFVMVLMQGRMIGPLSKKYGEKKLVVAGSVLVAIGLALTPLSKEVWLLYAAMGLLAIGSGMTTPSNQSILSKLANKESVGGVMGVGQSLSTLGRILGPIAGGAAFQFLGMSSPYMIGAATMMLAFAVGLALPEPAQTDVESPESAKQPEPSNC